MSLKLKYLPHSWTDSRDLDFYDSAALTACSGGSSFYEAGLVGSVFLVRDSVPAPKSRLESGVKTG